MLHRSVSFLLTVIVLFTRLNFPALLPDGAEVSPCGTADPIFLPLISKAYAMSQPTILENLEEIMTADAAFPFDAVVTQIFTNTVNVKPVGSRTIIRDVALPEFIKPDDLKIGYPVRLGHSGSKVTVTAYFEQFADPESFNYAGLGSKIPAKPTLSVQATKAGWVLTWPKVTYATKYIVYQNDTADSDSPELVQTLNVTNPNLATYSLTLHYDSPFIYFAVQACNGLLEGDTSLWMTDATPPAAPTWKAHAYQTGGHYLEWTHPAPADVKEFVLYDNTSASDSGAVEVARTANLNTIAPYVDGRDYFGVQAVDWSGINKSALVWTGPYDPTPATPTGLVVNMIQDGSMVSSWNAAALAVSYQLEGGTDSEIGFYGSVYYNGPSLIGPGVRVEGAYQFRVRAQGIDGSYSAWSAPVAAVDVTGPAKPTLATTPGADSVTVALSVSDISHSSVGFKEYSFYVADGPAGQNMLVLDSHALYESFPRTLAQQRGVTKYFRLIPIDWAGVQGPASDWTAATPIMFGEGGATVQDKFDTYGGSALTPLESLYWLSLAKVEQSESWTLSPSNLATWVSTNLIEGTKAIRLVSNTPGLATYIQIAKSMNLTQEGRFTNDDYLVIQTRVADMGNQKVTIIFYNTTGYPGGSGYKRTFDTTVDFPSPFVAKRSEFQAYGASPNWATIAGMQLYVENVGMQNLDITIDDIRIVKADPDDATKYNDTGAAWDYAKSSDIYGDGEWHIFAGNRTSEPGKPFSLGQVNAAYGTPDHWYLAHKPLTDTDISTGTIQAGLFHKENGTNGLAFYIKDVTPDAWTMYAVEADNVGDTVKLVRWSNGNRTELGSASFAFISAAGGAAGQTIWLGVDFSQYGTDAGRLKVYASTVEGNLIQAGNLKISVQDTMLGSGGTVGLLSYQANVRFVNFIAGSPAHAEVADVAKALDGPIVAGDVRRVHYDLALNRFRYTDDGTTFANLAVDPDANKVDKVSLVNRPGVIKLYRNDSDSGYSVQTLWDGARWLLQGYDAANAYHAPARVAYADVGNAANTLGGYTAAQLKATGSVVYLNADITGLSGTYTIVWDAYWSTWNTGNYWDGSTKLVAARTGWHAWFFCCQVQPNTTNTDNVVIYVQRAGSNRIGQHNDRRTASLQSVNASISGFAYLSAGDYIQAMATVGTTAFSIPYSNGCYFGLLSLESA